MIRTIVFDFGNVVAFFDHSRTLRRLAGHTHLTADEISRAFYATDLEDAYESGRLTTAEFLGRLREICCLRCDEEHVAEAWGDIFWPNEEVCALIPSLKGRYKLLLGSNTNELHARRFCRDFAETLAHFDALVFSHQVGARKPLAAFFQHCQRLADSRPEECLFIDDLPANVEGARACGWHGLVYTNADELKKGLSHLGVHV